MKIPATIKDRAAQWLVRRHAGLPPSEAAQLDAWLAADRRHHAAFAELEAAWSALSFPGTVGRAGEAREQLDARAGRRTRRRLAAGLASAGIAAAIALGFALAPPRAQPEAAAAAVSFTPRPNLQTLPDGSTVELNADAEIAVDFSAGQRAVRLLRGEALFSVTPNPARPFVVTAGGVAVRAVGTAFIVRHGAAEIGVLVTEGHVAVARTAAEPIVLAVGGRAEVPLDVARAPVVAAAPLSAAEMAAALAWRGRRVEFTRTTLAEAVALLNRQNRVQIAIADPAIGRIAISGIFWADEPESFVRLVEAGFAVKGRRAGDIVTLHRP